MKYSKLFGKTLREAPADEVSVSSQLLMRGGFIDKLQAGVYTFLPLGWRVMQKIEQVIREEMDTIDGQEMFMPSLHPKSNWEKTGRYEAVDVLFKFTSFFSENDYVLAPTHEEVIAPLAAKFVSSYKDLPFAAYQFQNKFRDEKRAKSGILRTREFVMKDLYSFHATAEDLDAYYDRAAEAYKRIFERLGIGEQTLMTFASGGTFSKFSHEFQAVTEVGEDVIYVCDNCGTAHNKEVFDEKLVEVGKCVDCGGSELKEVKAAEVGNIFKLMTKYSAPFELNFTDQSGEQRPVLMGCYGIGLARCMGVIVEILHDDRGITWPKALAPYSVYLIGLGENGTAQANELYAQLTAAGIEVLFDDRTDVSAGVKFADADLIGLPTRVVISDKTVEAGKVEVKERTQTDIEMLTVDELKNRVTP